jgi:hypothetical protein
VAVLITHSAGSRCVAILSGVDVSGKVLIMLVNQPLALNKSQLTYYGRWTYKYEEARRRVSWTIT